MIATISSDNDISELLSQQVSKLQQEVISLPFHQALREETLPLRLYIGSLEAYLAVHRTLEAQLKAHPHPLIRAVWRSEMERTSVLERDLSNFQSDIPTAPVQRATSAFVHYVEEVGQTYPLALLGIVYGLHWIVVNMQNDVSHLQQTFDLKENGVAFYCSYGATQMSWEDFNQRINSTLNRLQDRQMFIEHVEETLNQMKNLLKALWQSR
jgi:heme oxygenase